MSLVAIRVRAFATKAASAAKGKPAAAAAAAADAATTPAADAAAAAAAATSNAPKEQRKAFDFSTAVYSAPPSFKLSGQADAEYPAWLSNIKKPRPSLREITSEHSSFRKLKRRGDIKTHNDEQGI